MVTPSQAPEIRIVTVMVLPDTALEISPAKKRKEKFIKTFRNGSESRAGFLREAEEDMVRAKAKGSRKLEAEKGDRSARTGAKERVTVATPPTASLPTTALKGEKKDHGKMAQRLCRRKRSSGRRKKSCRWL
jgi:hypothetical protein